jgi:hypothetical protein
MDEWEVMRSHVVLPLRPAVATRLMRRGRVWRASCVVGVKVVCCAREGWMRIYVLAAAKLDGFFGEDIVGVVARVENGGRREMGENGRGRVERLYSDQ